MALPFDDGFSVYNVERLRTAGTLLLGARRRPDRQRNEGR